MGNFWKTLGHYCPNIRSHWSRAKNMGPKDFDRADPNKHSLLGILIDAKTAFEI